MNAAELITVTVTYHPDPDILGSQLRALPDASLKMIVDNASGAKAGAALRRLSHDIANTHLIRNIDNIGLAAALNQGAALAKQMRPDAKWCLLLDQDSEPQPGSIAELIAGMTHLLQNGVRPACVGPLLIDATTGLSHGFHQASKWRWRRLYPTAGATSAVKCSNLNGSGTLVPIDLFLAESLDESLFIDHVDTEWSFRLLGQGYSLWGIPRAVFIHRMGEGSLRFWFLGWRIWPARSPKRHYYLFRNALWLMRLPHVPNVWKIWAVIKLALTCTAHGLLDRNRAEQLHAMARGLKAGLSTPKNGGIRPMNLPSIIGLTLNYRDATRTQRCVQSLLEDGAAHVLIWDNSADDGASGAQLRDKLNAESRISIACSPVNLGFAVGVNRGLDWIRTHHPDAWVLLINNDATLVSGAIKALRNALFANPAAVIAYPDIDHNGRVMGTVFYQRHSGLITRVQLPGGIPHASGCCQLLATERLLGAWFDEDFFMYGEDVELGYRLGTERMVHVPQVWAMHEGSASSHMGSPFYEGSMAAAHWLLARKLARNRTEWVMNWVGRLFFLPFRAAVRAWRFRSLTPIKKLFPRTGPR